MPPQTLQSTEVPMTATMEHSEFVRRWGQGELLVDVSSGAALSVAGSKLLPRRYRVAHHFWSTVWLLTIPAAIAIMLFYKWWVGVLILVFLTPALYRAVRRSAMQFMIDYALESPDFYRLALEKGILTVRTKDDASKS